MKPETNLIPFIIQIILKYFFSWLKYEYTIRNIVFSCEKVILSESGEKYAQINHHLQVKTVKCVGDWRWTFPLEEALLWIIDYYNFFSRSNSLKLNPWWICFLQTCIFSLHKMFIDGQELFELLVYCCDGFISGLAPIHCRGSIDEHVMEGYISPNLFPRGNKLTSRMVWG